MRVRLRGINTIRRLRVDGTEVVHRYHRATGTPLIGEPNSPEFIESYAAAERSMRERNRGTLADLVRRFEASPEYADMAETTRTEYRRKFKRIDREWGSCPISALTDAEFRKDVLGWRDELAIKIRREADNLVSALARVLAFAVDRAELEANVLDRVRRVYQSDRTDKLWLPEHVAAFTRVAPPELCCALMLAMHTGQRHGDLLKLPWSAWDGERISLRQGKGGRLVEIRATVALRRTLEGVERVSPLILTTRRGRAWKKRYFAEQWQEACEAAGIVDLHFHDLRGTAVTMLAEAGCTIPEIAAVTGHGFATAERILETYLSRTRSLADAAIFKLERRLQNRP